LAPVGRAEAAGALVGAGATAEAVFSSATGGGAAAASVVALVLVVVGTSWSAMSKEES